MPDNTVRTRLLARGLRSAQGSIRYVSPVRPNAAAGLVAKVYQQVESDYGFLAPPITLHSPLPDAMAASWVMLRETLLASGRADRVVKEAIASARRERATDAALIELTASASLTAARRAAQRYLTASRPSL